VYLDGLRSADPMPPSRTFSEKHENKDGSEDSPRESVDRSLVSRCRAKGRSVLEFVEHIPPTQEANFRPRGQNLLCVS